MNKKRIISGILLIVALLAIIFWGNQYIFGGLCMLVVGLAGWEWSRLSSIQSYWLRAAYTAVMFIAPVLMTIAKYLPSQCLWLAILFLLYGFITVLFVKEGRKSLLQPAIIRGLMGLIVIPVAGLCIYELYTVSISALLFLFAYVWTADIFAYYFGKGFGKHKMIPAVSPGKTWEGFGGAVIGNILVTVGLLSYLSYPVKAMLIFGPVVVFIMLVFCVMGDLLVSHLKRLEGLKDSGRLIPGHGGILDRIDSLLAAAPIYFLIYMFIYVIRVF